MGIDQGAFLDVIGTGGLSSPYSNIKSQLIVKNNFSSAFALKHMAKDLRLAVDENLDTPLGKTAYESYQKAEEALGEEDVMAIIKHLKQ
jgi:3-hydroxyisobutyrate dehydrogenase